MVLNNWEIHINCIIVLFIEHLFIFNRNLYFVTRRESRRVWSGREKKRREWREIEGDHCSGGGEGENIRRVWCVSRLGLPPLPQVLLSLPHLLGDLPALPGLSSARGQHQPHFPGPVQVSGERVRGSDWRLAGTTRMSALLATATCGGSGQTGRNTSTGWRSMGWTSPWPSLDRRQSGAESGPS